ncbi:hypothetical protein J4444_01035 [Candidatus Woesearchaeota archaeon]|nr:hypothetical protein [uncultured archaeon]MBS3165683.1 hypothetical protein [Candidatus Woesearchaeota archaeon]
MKNKAIMVEVDMPKGLMDKARKFAKFAGLPVEVYLQNLVEIQAEYESRMIKLAKGELTKRR